MTRERICLVLLRLYPASFRKRYGSEIIETMMELRRTTTVPGFRFWLSIGADTCGAAFEERLTVWRSRSHPTAKWIAACAIGAVAWKAVGTALAWVFAYLYHPYLEGTVLSPWFYGATLGAGLGSAQCVVLRRLPRSIWILVSAAFAAVGFEVAAVVDSQAGPLEFGVIIGAAVACGQWLVLRERFQRASWLAAFAAIALSVAAMSLGVTRVPMAMNALNHYAVDTDPRPTSLAYEVYLPANWTDWTVGMLAFATAGAIAGAITARRVSSLLSNAR